MKLGDVVRFNVYVDNDFRDDWKTGVIVVNTECDDDSILCIKYPLTSNLSTTCYRWAHEVCFVDIDLMASL